MISSPGNELAERTRNIRRLFFLLCLHLLFGPNVAPLKGVNLAMRYSVYPCANPLKLCTFIDHPASEKVKINRLSVIDLSGFSKHSMRRALLRSSCAACESGRNQQTCSHRLSPKRRKCCTVKSNEASSIDNGSPRKYPMPSYWEKTVGRRKVGCGSCGKGRSHEGLIKPSLRQHVA